MPDRYSKSFVAKVAEDMKAAVADKSRATDGFEVEVSDGWAEVPVLEICRAVGAADEETGIDFADEVLLMRYMTLKRRVVVYYDGKEIGKFQANSLTDDFNLFPPFKDYPMALRFLMNVCTAYILKKSMPPRKAPTQAAQTGGQKT